MRAESPRNERHHAGRRRHEEGCAGGRNTGHGRPTASCWGDDQGLKAESCRSVWAVLGDRGPYHRYHATEQEAKGGWSWSSRAAGPDCRSNHPAGDAEDAADDTCGRGSSGLGVRGRAPRRLPSGHEREAARAADDGRRGQIQRGRRACLFRRPDLAGSGGLPEPTGISVLLALWPLGRARVPCRGQGLRKPGRYYGPTDLGAERQLHVEHDHSSRPGA
mmetsp:Transcript_1241/g.3621  ORF Transcript_1241/g.3621 Transcript_1241/m.3621 type:complete len:219 (+) Transcript_1241:220-876(+)